MQNRSVFFSFDIVFITMIILNERGGSTWKKIRKKKLMFERMREKKKEVKMVRRIVLAIAFTYTYYWIYRR